ncbi:Ig-like domain-containing protein [Candidatus Enterococcus mansonii]|uniref:BIG2 domain-containing protein n=1 Tax=Candidatus Enterococcus mansonii TaxID=1834181 RepID=A0A242CFE4_9ENTE|nr:Ig-like domain-containing protein [Enterococcus sp. 4G2_DIV0659]OTO08957.1 hypothetical protein A5880_001957 [Enterococcus sp. 4G2_DIV0659]
MKKFKLGFIGMALLGTSLIGLSPTSHAVEKAKAPAAKEVVVTPNEVAPEDIVVEHTQVEVNVGESIALKASVLPENATNKQLYWDTTDEGIVTVDANGKITGVNAGETVIDVTTADGKITKQIFVTVNEVAPEEIKVEKEQVELTVGESMTLNASVLPENATDKELFWIPMDESIATVDDNGKITGVNPGKTEILVLSVTNFGDIEKTITVTVNKQKPANLTFSQENGLYFSKQDIRGTSEVAPNANKKATVLLHLSQPTDLYDLKIGEVDFAGGTGVYNVQPITLDRPMTKTLYAVSTTRILDNSKLIIMYVDKKDPTIVKDYFVVNNI